ncbi:MULTISPECIES: hypothetical protein [unclassified Methylobacterium]|uniref:hypothetical protein n=1 Tax=unclassified Methylobacterium TaxID=2615210 RepID=UPI0011C1D212|nr:MULTISPECIES: hypothetical protein [unclassified Methylobacterium]QEE37979.1 hypothetical protein FVA80_02340 [Methylobacterium sp. WL1]
MGKAQVFWIDRARTKTAADVETLEECENYIRRISRNIAELREQGANKPEAPRDQRLALFARNQALRELKARRAALDTVEI